MFVISQSYIFKDIYQNLLYSYIQFYIYQKFIYLICLFYLFVLLFYLFIYLYSLLKEGGHKIVGGGGAMNPNDGMT